MNDIEKAFRGLGRTKKVELSLKKLIMHRHMPLQGMCQVIFLMC